MNTWKHLKAISLARRNILLYAVACAILGAFSAQSSIAQPGAVWDMKNKTGNNIPNVDVWWTNAGGARTGLVEHVSSWASGEQRSYTIPATEFDVTTTSQNIKRTTMNDEGMEISPDGTWVTNLPAVLGNFAISQLQWPSLFFSPDQDIFVAIDVNAFYRAGAPQYNSLVTFDIVNGTSPLLPGYLFGTTDVYIDPLRGLVTDNPLTESGIQAAATDRISVAPEPATLGLVFATGFWLVRPLARRRASRILTGR